MNEENIYECKLRGTLKVKNDKMNCIIGDLVEFDEKEKVIEKIEKRKNFLYRPLIANIDFIGILFAIKSPDFDFTNFQKMLLNANSQNIPVVLILSKTDLVSQEELEDFFNKFKKIFKEAISIFPISTETRTGLSELKQYINKKSVVISGPSGAGKSTLINTLIGEEVLTTNDVSGKTGKGRHTTIESRFFMTAPHSYLIDTPGFSTLDFPKLKNKKELEISTTDITKEIKELESKNIEIKKVEKNADNTKVTFNADIVIKKELSLKLTNSVIYFDNHTNAVKRIIFNDTKRSVSQNVSKESKIPFKSISDNFSLDITFSNYKNKLLFSSLYVKAKGGIEYNNKRDNLQTEQSFLRTGVTKGQIKKNDRIDVEKPFFEYVTPHKQGEAKFLLTKEEQDFINQ